MPGLQTETGLGPLARLREVGAKIIEMELQPPDLEDVFLRLTGK